jgi:hypothetical protein
VITSSIRRASLADIHAGVVLGSTCSFSFVSSGGTVDTRTIRFYVAFNPT